MEEGKESEVISTPPVPPRKGQSMVDIAFIPPAPPPPPLPSPPPQRQSIVVMDITTNQNNNNNSGNSTPKKTKKKILKFKAIKGPSTLKSLLRVMSAERESIPIAPPPPPIFVYVPKNQTFEVKVNETAFQLDIGERYEALLTLLATPKVTICKALLVISTSKNLKFIVKAMANLFAIGGKSVELVTPFIIDEVQKTEHKSTLFRGSESSAKLISAISNVLGKDFLIQSLSYPLQKLQEMLDQELFFEVNPMNCDPSILPQNIENLKKICGIFLDSVISNAEFLPQTLKNVCRRLREETKDKFENSRDYVIGGFFFLRFVCPAIVTPHSMNIIEEQKSPVFRRTLVMISKILQNLSNGVKFGKKEEYMSTFNEFIDENLPRVSKLFDYFCEDNNYCSLPDSSHSIEVDTNVFDDLIFFLCNDKELVISEMLQFCNKDIPLLESEMERIHAFGRTYNPIRKS